MNTDSIIRKCDVDALVEIHLCDGNSFAQITTAIREEWNIGIRHAIGLCAQSLHTIAERSGETGGAARHMLDVWNFNHPNFTL